jgi:DNA-binding response OmpR family regulator
MKSIKILYIEDDLLTAENIIKFLEDEKFTVFHTDTIVDALAQIKINSYNIVLLDLNLQDYSGFEFLKNLKKSLHIPVIVISALSETSVKLQAFRYGASDYMVKPIDLEELEARIWVQLSKNSEIKMQDDKKVFTIKESCILFKQNILNLTNIEFETLSILIQNANQVVQRDTLISSLSSISSPRSLDNHIKNIRKKIEDDKTPNTYLKTHYGVGYSLRNETISSGV